MDFVLRCDLKNPIDGKPDQLAKRKTEADQAISETSLVLRDPARILRLICLTGGPLRGSCLRPSAGCLVDPPRERRCTSQELMYQAFRTPDPGSGSSWQGKHSSSVLTSPTPMSCSPTHQEPHEALDLFEKGVAAGKGRIGPGAFQEMWGHFWSLLETRPCMRAREGRRANSGAWVEETSPSNTSRTCCGSTPVTTRDCATRWPHGCSPKGGEELAHLLEQYDEPSTAWAYTKALVAFARRGHARVSKAARWQPGRRTSTSRPICWAGSPLPKEEPGYFSPGDRSEAVLYVGAEPERLEGDARSNRMARSDRDWSKKEKSREDPLRVQLLRSRATARPTAGRRCLAGGLPPAPSWVEGKSGRFQPWIIMVTSRTDDVIVVQKITEDPPDAALVWEPWPMPWSGRLTASRIDQTSSRCMKTALGRARLHLEEVGISCTAADELDHMDLVFASLASHLTKDERPGLLDMPGVTPAQVAGLLPGGGWILPESSPGGSWVTKRPSRSIREVREQSVVRRRHGAIGADVGVSLFEDLNALKSMWLSAGSDAQNAREMVTLTLIFGEQTEISVPRSGGWPEARLGASWTAGVPINLPQGAGHDGPPAARLGTRLMEGCLRAIPAFIARHKPDDLSKHKMSVPVASGSLTLTLSWVEECRGMHEDREEMAHDADSINGG